MKKIITAMGNPYLNEILKKEENKICVSYKDIQYKEGIIEILEKDHFIDLIIINEDLPGKIEINKLLKKIIEINTKIYIIIFSKNNKKNKIENNNIFYFYDIENNYYLIKEKLINENHINQNFLKTKNNNYNNKYIAIKGLNNIGKTIISIIIANLISKENYKILLVDMDCKNGDINTIFQIKKNINKIQNITKNLDFICIENPNLIKSIGIKYDFIFIDNCNKKILLDEIKNIIFICESNLISIIKSKKILKKLIKPNEKNIIFILNFYNKNSIDIQIIKNIFNKIKFIEKINYDEKYNLLINNFNRHFISIFFRKKYKKVIEYIIKNK